MAYTIYKTDGALFVNIEDGQIDTVSSSLTLIGKNVVNYGQYQNTNMVHMLENFSNMTSPANPVTGQLWFDKTASNLRLNVYNGSSWKSVPNFNYSNTLPTLNTGDFWWDTANEVLYIRGSSSNIVIGGSNSTATSAAKLATARTINGVSFDGTANITVSSTLTNSLTFGDYLVGGTFNGSSATTVSVDVGSVVAATPSKVVARDSSGNIYFNVGFGTATASRYADLAEKYLPDQDYDVGTVMVVGGSAEVTQSSGGDRAIGVISAKPGLMMNQDLENGVYVALKGRVPVKIHGSITKGQRLIAGPSGCAVGVFGSHPDVFAIALEDSKGNNVVEAIIL